MRDSTLRPERMTPIRCAEMGLADKWMPLIEHIVSHYKFGTLNKVSVRPVFRPDQTRVLLFRICMEVVPNNGKMFQIVSTPAVIPMEQDCFTKAKVICTAKAACRRVKDDYDINKRLFDSPSSSMHINQIGISPTGRVPYEYE